MCGYIPYYDMGKSEAEVYIGDLEIHVLHLSWEISGCFRRAVRADLILHRLQWCGLINTVCVLDWPAFSPDLSPFENV